MLLARFVDECLEIRCVEVKERQGGNVSDKLIERIAEQLNNTVEILADRFLSFVEGGNVAQKTYPVLIYDNDADTDA